MLVLDASIPLAWMLADESSAGADAVRHEIEHAGGIVPALWTVEVLNGILMAQRRSRITSDHADHLLAAVAALCSTKALVVAEITPEEACAGIAMLARDHALTAYDASYLYLAKREGVRLATLDKALRAAAARAGVATLP